MFPHPAAVPLTTPMIFPLNMVLIQYWHDTNVAKEKPIINLTAMYPPAEDTNDMQNTVGADNMMRNAQPYRGPSKSQTAPIANLEKMLPETEAMPALPMSCFVRLRLSRMIGTRGAAAKVEMKHVKNEVQHRWKVLMCGLARDRILKTLALCSESRGW